MRYSPKQRLLSRNIIAGKKRKNADISVLDEDESKRLSPLVDIKNLPKERVLISLFDNVYKKSAASRLCWFNTVNLYYPDLEQKAPVGTYSSPTETQAREILFNTSSSQRHYIDYVGTVMFRIDFGSDVINTKVYDETHETGTNSAIKPAYVCINELRVTIALEQKVLAEQQKKLAEEKARTTAADKQLREILGHENCSIKKLPFMEAKISFEPHESYKKLQSHAKKLIELGLSVKIKKKCVLLGGLTTIPAELKLSFESGVSISFQYLIHLLSQYFSPPGASFVGGWQR